MRCSPSSSEMHLGASSADFLFTERLGGLSIFLSTLKALGLTSDMIVVLTFVPAFIILLCFVVLAALLLVTLVESYIVVTGGLFFVGFVAFRGTAPMGDGYLQYVVYVGIKLFFLILVASVAAAIGDDMVTLIGRYDNLWLEIIENLFRLDPRGAAGAVTSRLGFLWSITAVAILLAVLGLTLPERIADRLSRHLSFNLKGMLQRL